MDRERIINGKERQEFNISRQSHDNNLKAEGGGHDPEYGGNFAPTKAQVDAGRAEMNEDLLERMKGENQKLKEKNENLELRLHIIENRIAGLMNSLRDEGGGIYYYNQQEALEYAKEQEGKIGLRLLTKEEIGNIEEVGLDDYNSLYTEVEVLDVRLMAEGEVITKQTPKGYIEASRKAAQAIKEGKSVIHVKRLGYYVVEKR